MESQILVVVLAQFPNILIGPWILSGFGITTKTDGYLYLTTSLETS